MQNRRITGGDTLIKWGGESESRIARIFPLRYREREKTPRNAKSSDCREWCLDPKEGCSFHKQNFHDTMPVKREITKNEPPKTQKHIKFPRCLGRQNCQKCNLAMPCSSLKACQIPKTQKCSRCDTEGVRNSEKRVAGKAGRNRKKLKISTTSESNGQQGKVHHGLFVFH